MADIYPDKSWPAVPEIHEGISFVCDPVEEPVLDEELVESIRKYPTGLQRYLTMKGVPCQIFMDVPQLEFVDEPIIVGVKS